MGDYTGLEQFAVWMFVAPLMFLLLGFWEKSTGIKIGGVWEVVVDVTPWKGIILWMIFWGLVLGVSQSCRGVSVRDRYPGGATAPRNSSPEPGSVADPNAGWDAATQEEILRDDAEGMDELLLIEEQHRQDLEEERRDTIWRAIGRLEAAGVDGLNVWIGAIDKALVSRNQPTLDDTEARLLKQVYTAPAPWGVGPYGAELRLDHIGDSERDELVAALETLGKPSFLLVYTVTVQSPKDEHELSLPGGRGWVRVDERGVVKIRGKALTKEALKKRWLVGRPNTVSVHSNGRTLVVQVNGVRIGPVELARPSGDAGWSLRTTPGTQLSSLRLLPGRTRNRVARRTIVDWVLDQKPAGCSQPILDPLEMSWARPDAPRAVLEETVTVPDGCLRRTQTLRLDWTKRKWRVAPSAPTEVGSCAAPCAPRQTKRLAGSWQGEVELGSTLELQSDGHFEHLESFEPPPFAPPAYENNKTRSGRWDARGGRVSLFYADGSVESLIELTSGPNSRLEGKPITFVR